MSEKSLKELERREAALEEETRSLRRQREELVGGLQADIADAGDILLLNPRFPGLSEAVDESRQHIASLERLLDEEERDLRERTAAVRRRIADLSRRGAER